MRNEQANIKNGLYATINHRKLRMSQQRLENKCIVFAGLFGCVYGFVCFLWIISICCGISWSQDTRTHIINVFICFRLLHSSVSMDFAYIVVVPFFSSFLWILLVVIPLFVRGLKNIVFFSFDKRSKNTNLLGAAFEIDSFSIFFQFYFVYWNSFEK